MRGDSNGYSSHEDKSAGLIVEDDYANIEKLIEDKIITPNEGDLLKPNFDS